MPPSNATSRFGPVEFPVPKTPTFGSQSQPSGTIHLNLHGFALLKRLPQRAPKDRLCLFNLKDGRDAEVLGRTVRCEAGVGLTFRPKHSGAVLNSCGLRHIVKLRTGRARTVAALVRAREKDLNLETQSA